jgi:hypothetical protein
MRPVAAATWVSVMRVNVIWRSKTLITLAVETSTSPPFSA